MQEYLEDADIDVNMITTAGLAYITALSNFLEFVPQMGTLSPTRRTVSELKATLNADSGQETPGVLARIPAANTIYTTTTNLGLLRQFLAERIALEFQWHEWIGIIQLDPIIGIVLNDRAFTEFTGTLKYSVDYMGQSVFTTSDYQLANGMLLGWTQYRESVSNGEGLPLTMSLNSRPLEAGTDIAFGLTVYSLPRQGDLYIIRLLHEVEVSGEDVTEYAIVRDPRYLQGYASMIHWLSRVYPNPNTELPEILWDFVEYNNNGIWAPAELQHPPTLPVQ